MDQSALIQSAKFGDLDAFNQLVLAYQDRLFNIAVRILENTECAADAVQNAFILAFRNIGKFHDGKFDFWLLRIVKNVCFDELRRRKQNVNNPIQLLMDDDMDDMSAWLIDHSQNLDELIDTAELSEMIMDGLQALTPDCRMIITLVDIDGLGYAEAAKVLGVPVGTVKSRLARARLRMRYELQRLSGSPLDLPFGSALVSQNSLVD